MKALDMDLGERILAAVLDSMLTYAKSTCQWSCRVSGCNETIAFGGLLSVPSIQQEERRNHLERAVLTQAVPPN